MSAQVYELPRVAHPLDQKQRFAWLLAARTAARRALDFALSLPRKAAAYVAGLVHRAHLSGAMSWLRRTAARVARPLMKVVGRLGKSGIGAAVVSVATDPTCRRLIRKAGSAVGRALSWVARKAYSGVDRVLRFFGRPGTKAADLMFSALVSFGGKVAEIATPVVQRVARLTDPEAAHVRVISGLARSFVLHRALKAVIGNRYLRALVETLVIPALVDSRVGQWVRHQVQLLKDRMTAMREQAETLSPHAKDGPNRAPEGDDTGAAFIEATGRAATEAPSNRAERRAAERMATGTEGMSHYPAKPRRRH